MGAKNSYGEHAHALSLELCQRYRALRLPIREVLGDSPDQALRAT